MYQYILSPVIPPVCRFYPSCSEYACLAVIRFGPFKGLLLSLKRISRCHPFNPGGFDPVPESATLFSSKKDTLLLRNGDEIS